MERRIAVRTLNQQTSAVLAEVVRGQSVTITRAGQPIARIVPIRPPSALDRLVAAGDAIPGHSERPNLAPTAHRQQHRRGSGHGPGSGAGKVVAYLDSSAAVKLAHPERPAPTNIRFCGASMRSILPRLAMSR